MYVYLALPLLLDMMGTPEMKQDERFGFMGQVTAPPPRYVSGGIQDGPGRAADRTRGAGSRAVMRGGGRVPA
ncbi:MAG: hypothetical protein QOF01_959 [Thermomicrobiales bacterium]|nr:hypothetical protein [Thermomicrobiales bacterium]